MKGQKYNNGIGLLLAGMLFSSCMHVGMMGTGDGHDSGAAHEMTTEPVLEKEVITGDVRAIALFPPLILGEDVTLTLKLMEARTSAPISGAQVYLHVQYVHPPRPHDDHVEASHQREDGEHDFNIDQEVKESSASGVYTTPYGAYQPGAHSLMFHITAIGDRKLEPEITVEATRILSEDDHENHDGMIGGTSTTTYVIIGAVVMGVMMIAMFAAHDGMF